MINVKHLFLTGFMGAGKTTIGKLLSKRLNMPVLDTDEYVETKQNKKITEIFSQDGEAVFREYETEALQEVSKLPPTIVTTGGGIILRAKNRKLMKSYGEVIFLFCDIEETMKRLENDDSRPLFKKDIEENKKRFEERLPLYKEATIIIDTTNKDLTRIIDEIMTHLE